MTSTLWALTEEARSLAAEIEQLAQRLYSDDADDAALAAAGLEDALLREAQNRDAFQQKADGYCYVISQLRGQAEWRREEARRLQTLADDDWQRAESLEALLMRVLTSLDPDATKFELPSHRITSRRSVAVEVGEDADIPAEFWSERVSRSPNKAMLRDAMEHGVEFPGVQLVERRNWRIG